MNKQWYHDSSHPKSLTHISTDDIQKMAQRNVNNLNGTKSKRHCLYNINKFENAQSLKVTRCRNVSKYFKNLDQFRNLSKFNMKFEGVQDEMDIMTKIVENNKNRLKSLTMNNQSHYSRCLKCECLQSVYLPRLTILSVSGIIVQGFYLNKEKSIGFGNSINSNFDNLQRLEMNYSHLIWVLDFGVLWQMIKLVCQIYNFCNLVDAKLKPMTQN